MLTNDFKTRCMLAAAAGLHTPGFVIFFLCGCVCECVCPPLRLIITSGVIWTTYGWLNKFYSCCMETVINEHGLGINTLRGN